MGTKSLIVEFFFGCRPLLSEHRYSVSNKYREFYCFDVAMLFANDCSTSVTFNRMVNKPLGMRSKLMLVFKKNAGLFHSK